jgi:hypothetical protein
MTVETVASSELFVCATLPTTNDAAGFGALSWVPVGEITDIPSVLGRTYNTSTHAPIASAQQLEKKASYKLGNADFTCGWDEDDAGQILIQALADHPSAIYAFKVVKQGGAMRYFTAQATGFQENMGTVDNVVQGKFTLLRQTDTIKA